MTDTTEAALAARYRDQHPTDGLWAQREAAPEVARAEAPGAGQMARRARRPSRGVIEHSYRRLALALEGHGPSTRKELHDITGMPVNSVNGRIAEMRELPLGHEYRVLTEGRRNGESIVHLARLRPKPESQP